VAVTGPSASSDKSVKAAGSTVELQGALAVDALVTDDDDLQRYVNAQAHAYAAVLCELNRGHKTSHWMWFIFPQLRGLGSSAMARKYGIGSLGEARAYLAHPLLGSRLRECLTILQDIPRADPQQVFGDVDALKLRSCLTLFLRAGGGELFEAALQRWFAGQSDERTDSLLESARR
jgi:uncharacterized protein (DUF1810 family)